MSLAPNSAPKSTAPKPKVTSEASKITLKTTAKPPVFHAASKTGKPPMDPMTHEIVKSVSKFLGKVNRHLGKSDLKIKLFSTEDGRPNAPIPSIKPSSIKK